MPLACIEAYTINFLPGIALNSEFDPIGYMPGFGCSEPNIQLHLMAKLSLNPVTNQALLEYTMETGGSVSVFISDYSGRRIMEVQSQQWLDNGYYQLIVPTEQLVPGMYFITLVRPEGTKTLRMLKQ